MPRPWDPDVEVTAALAAKLIDSQFPELAPARVEPLAMGWDNAAFAVNGAWVFRLPTRKLGATAMEIELKWLPGIAGGLPARISSPEKAGRPEGGYPYAFAGYRRIDGDTGCRAGMTGAQALALAEEVGAFLAALHRIEVPPGAPGDAIFRTDLPRRVARLQEALGRLSAGMDVAPAQKALETLASTPPWTGRPAWLHGDLYGRHLVLDGRRRLAGVIDWGDLHAGDPALDLSIAFSFFEGAARSALLGVYGPVDSATLDRARFRALNYGVILKDYGRKAGDPAMEALGDAALIRNS